MTCWSAVIGQHSGNCIRVMSVITRYSIPNFGRSGHSLDSFSQSLFRLKILKRVQFLIEHSPNMFYGVQIRRIWRPFYWLNAPSVELLHCVAASVRLCSILHEQPLINIISDLRSICYKYTLNNSQINLGGYYAIIRELIYKFNMEPPIRKDATPNMNYEPMLFFPTTHFWLVASFDITVDPSSPVRCFLELAFIGKHNACTVLIRQGIIPIAITNSSVTSIAINARSMRLQKVSATHTCKSVMKGFETK